MTELHWLDGAEIVVPANGKDIWGEERYTVAAWEHSEPGGQPEITLRLFNESGQYLISILGWEEHEGLDE